MSNPFYNPTGTPVTSSFGASANIRAEFQLVEAGFAKLPATLTANKAVVINSAGTAMTVTAGTLSLLGNLTVASGKTLTASNTLTFTGTDGSSVNFGTGGTVLYSGGSYVASIAGTANEITASAATGAVTLSLPSALTFTGKTITGGTYASVTSINGLTITSSTGTLTITNGKTAAISNTLTFTGTDGSSVNFGAGGTVLYSGGAGFVSSIAGTANEITASAATGAVTLSLPSALTFTGKTITGGTYASPTISGTVAGAHSYSGALTFSAAITYGGVTLSNSVTGTGSMVLSASPSLTGNVSVLTGTAATDALALRHTAGSGAVLSLRTDDATTRFIKFNFNGTQVAEMYCTTANLRLVPTNKFEIYTGSTHVVSFGHASSWGMVEIAAGYNGGSLAIGTTRYVNWTTTTLQPEADNTLSLGTTSLRWTKLWANGADLGGALTYGGVTLSNSVTGTGSMVLSAGATLTGTVVYSAAAKAQFNRADNTRSGFVQYTADGLTLDSGANDGLYIDHNGTTQALFATDGSFLVGTETSGGWTGLAKIEAVTTNLNGISGYATGAGNAFKARIDSTSGTFMEFNYTTTAVGSITTNGTTTAYNTTSDYRVKTLSGAYVGAGAVVDALPIHLGRYNTVDHEQPLFLAHELQDVGAGYAVTGEKDGERMQQVDTAMLLPLLWAALKETRAELAVLKAAR